MKYLKVILRDDTTPAEGESLLAMIEDEHRSPSGIVERVERYSDEPEGSAVEPQSIAAKHEEVFGQDDDDRVYEASLERPFDQERD